jgi:hypothetical protein
MKCSFVPILINEIILVNNSRMYRPKPRSSIGSDIFFFSKNLYGRVPVLAGAAGSLGSSYCPPYITLDGGYYNNASRPSSQISSAPARCVSLFCSLYVTVVIILLFLFGIAMV